ncbi:hypothetical protein [Phycisphaera mikurensis]|uniref:Uncharacterized protein n=1 Tax=Phycisphaera mikurensis (strain NBRC 102666 / KCTC 22515 / FYK2301M01) TaxID=1142394 RepID=I0IE73_PHYMF|nr:hypothetical protein [Phycisphaera mikurensis]MBB6441363.1 hypothetical protein [Phycisphaera mikurensis]BAM03561.1 hypothetical protein PSMK_14020 [Phycisphaera mikurensis NBRC 102666]
MSRDTRNALLRAALVLVFGFAAVLLVLAFQRHDAAGGLEEDLADLTAALEEKAAADPAGEDDLGERVGERMRQRFVFGSAPEDRFRSVRGVLGDRVFFEGGESVRVGESFDGAEVLGVGAESVRFRHEGEEVTIDVGGGGGGGASGGFGGFSGGPSGFGGFPGGDRPRGSGNPRRPRS